MSYKDAPEKVKKVLVKHVEFAMQEILNAQVMSMPATANEQMRKQAIEQALLS